MLDQAMLEALRDAFWPVYLLSVSLAAFVAWKRSAWCMGRAVFAMLLVSVGQWAWEPVDGYLQWYQHLALSLPAFVLVTMPPRHYWQSALGALFFAQIVLHCIWGFGEAVEGMARWHWFGCITLGFAKCGVLMMWTGGGRVESLVARSFGRIVSRVLGKASGQPAQ